MKTLLAMTALATGLLTAGASAQSVVVLGTLTCTGGEGVGLIIGSQKSYDCSFKPAGTGPVEPYAATVTKLGLDIGVTDRTTMIWTVLSAVPGGGARALSGSYAGAVADASLGIGAGAKVLIGGLRSSITLQPVSVQGQTGVNLAIGVGEMELR